LKNENNNNRRLPCYARALGTGATEGPVLARHDAEQNDLFQIRGEANIYRLSSEIRSSSIIAVRGASADLAAMRTT
jgi:hypothetical protein